MGWLIVLGILFALAILHVGVFVSYDCYNNSLQIWWFKNNTFFFSGSPKSKMGFIKVLQGYIFPSGSRGQPVF